MSAPFIRVLKFGSSVLRSEEDLPLAVHEIYRFLRRGERVVAVTSAIGDTTDELLARAGALDGEQQQDHLAALLATGEEAAAAMLAMACERAGLRVARLDAVHAGFRTSGPLGDAELTEIDTGRIHAALADCPLVVLAGFVGRSDCGRTAVLGRGGSDLTALFVAEQLDARRVRLIKAVDGIYDCDPIATQASTARFVAGTLRQESSAVRSFCPETSSDSDADGGSRANTSEPRRYEQLSWDDLDQLGGGVVQPKAIAFARERGLVFEVGGIAGDSPTRVGPFLPRTSDKRAPRPPLRVALCGLGTVGSGVLRHLLARPESFVVCSALVRDPDKARAGGVGETPLRTEIAGLLGTRPDVVVELIGGTDDAVDIVDTALDRGIDVVSANKAALQRCVRDWQDKARERDCHLLYSASVGGGAPFLERVRELRMTGGVQRLRGVLNGSTNYILDHVANGQSFADALAAAQASGFAEADPKLDLDGTDAAQKLELLTQAAWGHNLPLRWIAREGIEGVDDEVLRSERRRGKTFRLVADAHLEGSNIIAELRLLCLDSSDPLASTRGTRNHLQMTDATGHTHEIDGVGAGRWPTAEAVIADIYDLLRLREERDEASPLLSIRVEEGFRDRDDHRQFLLKHLSETTPDSPSRARLFAPSTTCPTVDSRDHSGGTR